MFLLMKSIERFPYSCAVGFDQFEVHYLTIITLPWLILISPQWAVESLWKPLSGHVCGVVQIRWTVIGRPILNVAAPCHSRQPELKRKVTKSSSFGHQNSSSVMEYVLELQARTILHPQVAFVRVLSIATSKVTYTSTAWNFPTAFLVPTTSPVTWHRCHCKFTLFSKCLITGLMQYAAFRPGSTCSAIYIEDSVSFSVTW